MNSGSLGVVVAVDRMAEEHFHNPGFTFIVSRVKWYFPSLVTQIFLRGKVKIFVLCLSAEEISMRRTKFFRRYEFFHAAQI